MPSKKYNNGRRREKTENDNEIVGIVLVIISAFVLLCIVIRPILGFISKAVYGVTAGVFGLFSYPLFLSTLILGIALLQGRRATLATRYKIGIACMSLSLMFILQLATTHGYLGENFSAYISKTYSQKTTAGGVLFGVPAYAVQAVATPVVSYIIFSLAFACSLVFFFLLPLYSKRRNVKVDDNAVSINPFIKGLASPQQTRPLTDNTLFVDTIRPVGQAALTEQDDSYAQKTEKQLDTQQQKIAPLNQRVEFEPYSEKNSSHGGYKSEAHKILFGNRAKYEQPAPLPTIDYAEVQKDYMAGYSLPPLVSSEPVVKDTTLSQKPRQVTETPSKPVKTVHKISDLGLADIPMLPEKDISSQIVQDGSAIINGDDLSRRLAEEMAPIQKERENERPSANNFSTRKIEPMSVRPKLQQTEEPSKIVNGDYFGMPNKPQTSAPSANGFGATRQQASYDPGQDVYAKREDVSKNSDYYEENDDNFVQEPIITGSEYEKRVSPENRFLEQIEEDRKRKAAAEKAPATYAFENVSDEETEPDIGESLFPEDLLKEDSALIADDMPEQPRKSSFNIIEDAIDLSEKSHLEGEDNTGYYNTVTFDVRSKPKEEKPPVRSQIKIDDYVATTPAPPKPKRKRHVKYNAPDIDFLVSSDSSVPENFNVACEEKARLLEVTLQELKLPVKVNGITRGPAVTRFELEMPPGIPIKRIEQFSTDIEYYLASNGKIRIEAPIPGKRAVGIEVPNEEIDIVRLREIIESKEFQNSSSPLTLSLGKDIAGSNIICNLEKMPHLLIAGATGSGKSACLNSIIISMLYKSSPEDVRLILIDPKRVEFNMYQGIPHLLGSDIINDAQQAINVLTWAKDEMDRRYTLFGNHRVRNLPEFNKSDAVRSGEEQKLPYIVLIVDELAELMLDNNKKVLEGKIMSIAQKARAAGIHLILATQRPSVDVITGTIKANLPSRIAFSVKSIVDSRTILDECGAETLLGRGDMLYSPVGMDDPKRVQGAFVTDKEVMAVAEYVRENNEADFDEEFTAAITKRNDEPETDGDDEEDSKEFDSLMPEVLKCVIESGAASTSMIQRRFSVGYARASRIIDQMELHKFIGPLEGSKPRAVYISREQYKELFGTDL